MGRLFCWRTGFLLVLGEDALPVPVQGVEVDVLDGEGVLVVAVELAASLGASGVDPVRCPVAGGVEPAGLDEGLGEDGCVAVGGPPVGGQAAGDAAEDRGGEVRDSDVGQDQEAGVAGDEVEPGFAGGGSQPMRVSRAAHFQADAAKLMAAMVPARSAWIR